MILKCKMCGGDIELSQDKTLGICGSCGSMTTFPKIDDEQRANMFNRGNHFRRAGEFDKALTVYEHIVQEDDNDAEAHWCCALCRFGIEYVEDPNTFEFLPTCHRASFDSFLEDVDYLAAVEHSEGVTRRQYQKDAAKIAEVQRGILATSQNEEPFDVFICYKESENDNTRTRDSLMAQEIYYQLTEQGWRVFFSRITLEDKAGTEYEPYIFAALNSAKVMIVVTTSAEHVNAVWVKNEWSRFLSLMRKDRNKLLLPCYRDMDPYDLPEALSVLQSYDMGKIGFIQDLIRGVNKVLVKDKPEKVTQQPIVQQVIQEGASAGSLLKRGQIFLSEGEWTSAEEYFNKVLDIDPENSGAYFSLMLAAARQSNTASFENAFINGQVHAGKEYDRAKRFADKGTAEWFHVLEAKKAEVDAERRRAEEERKRAEEERKRAEEERRIAEEKTAEKARLAAEAETLRRFEEAKAKLEPVRCRIAQAQKLISAGEYHTVGLKADGTVLAIMDNDDQIFNHGQCEISDWKDIVAISAGEEHTVGLKADGTVVAVGDNFAGQCDVSGWKDIVAISAGKEHTVGLKANGTVLATKYTGNQDYYCGQCDVSDWKNIVAISAGKEHTIGLKANGTVLATKYTGNHDDYCGQCETSGWKDIVAVSAGDDYTVGLKADGTVLATKYTGNQDYYCGQCDVSGWKDIVAINAGVAQAAGLKADGTVIWTTEDNTKTVSGWKLFNSIDTIEQEHEAAKERCVMKLTADLAAEQQRKNAAETELANLRGLFSGKRRKELEAQIAEDVKTIERLQNELKTLGS